MGCNNSKINEFNPKKNSVKLNLSNAEKLEKNKEKLKEANLIKKENQEIIINLNKKTENIYIINDNHNENETISTKLKTIKKTEEENLLINLNVKNKNHLEIDIEDSNSKIKIMNNNKSPKNFNLTEKEKYYEKNILREKYSNNNYYNYKNNNNNSNLLDRSNLFFNNIAKEYQLHSITERFSLENKEKNETLMKIINNETLIKDIEKKKKNLNSDTKGDIDGSMLDKLSSIQQSKASNFKECRSLKDENEQILNLTRISQLEEKSRNILNSIENNDNLAIKFNMGNSLNNTNLKINESQSQQNSSHLMQNNPSILEENKSFGHSFKYENGNFDISKFSKFDSTNNISRIKVPYFDANNQDNNFTLTNASNMNELSVHHINQDKKNKINDSDEEEENLIPITLTVKASKFEAMYPIWVEKDKEVNFKVMGKWTIDSSIPMCDCNGYYYKPRETLSTKENSQSVNSTNINSNVSNSNNNKINLNNFSSCNNDKIIIEEINNNKGITISQFDVNNQNKNIINENIDNNNNNNINNIKENKNDNDNDNNINNNNKIIKEGNIYDKINMKLINNELEIDRNKINNNEIENKNLNININIKNEDNLNNNNININKINNFNNKREDQNININNNDNDYNILSNKITNTEIVNINDKNINMNINIISNSIINKEDTIKNTNNNDINLEKDKEISSNLKNNINYYTILNQKNNPKTNSLIQDLPNGSLIGRILGGDYFHIFNNFNFISNVSGPLFLKMNIHDLRLNPEGKLTVFIIGAMDLPFMHIEKRLGWDINILSLGSNLLKSESEKLIYTFINKIRLNSNLFAQQYLENIKSLSTATNALYFSLLENKEKLQFLHLDKKIIEYGKKLIKLEIQRFYNNSSNGIISKKKDEINIDAQNLIEAKKNLLNFGYKKIMNFVKKHEDTKPLSVAIKLIIDERARNSLLNNEYNSIALLTVKSPYVKRSFFTCMILANNTLIDNDIELNKTQNFITETNKIDSVIMETDKESD
jgi:hypothetical protein